MLVTLVQDIRLKYACGASPSVASFCLAIYESPHMAEPLEIWQFFVHAVERIDMVCVPRHVMYTSPAFNTAHKLNPQTQPRTH